MKMFIIQKWRLLDDTRDDSIVVHEDENRVLF